MVSNETSQRKDLDGFAVFMGTKGLMSSRTRRIP